MNVKKLIFNLVFVAAAVACGIFLSLRPWRVYLQVRRQADLQIEAMKQAEARHAQDLIEEARYSSTSGREELARRRGLRKTNEIPTNP
jgi:hypothetical protein